MIGRRLLLALAAAGALPARALAPRTLVFPRDHGSHPDLRTEWWYATGHAQTDGGRSFGFQVTFFRSRVDAAQPLRSTLAAKQLVFAHAAVTDLQAGRLLHDQRIARAGFGIAEASEADTAVHIRDWRFVRSADGTYDAAIPAEGFALALRLAPTQPLLLQGAAGLSRKGPLAENASHYYSQPQLAASGSVRVGGTAHAVRGTAWLDHEWSTALLHPDAVGWDWIGMNLADGAALTAFRLRRRDGGTLWTGGSFRARGGAVRAFDDGSVRFTPLRTWTSAATRARYPVAWRIDTPAGTWDVRALLDDQELDSRASTGAVYWEGLSDLLDTAGRPVGRGYLEMTGYAGVLRL